MTDHEKLARRCEAATGDDAEHSDMEGADVCNSFVDWLRAEGFKKASIELVGSDGYTMTLTSGENSEADYSIWASRGPTALRTLDQQPSDATRRLAVTMGARFVPHDELDQQP